MEPLDDVEVRVLGCLIEKEATVPDTYPMTLKGLRQACNQSTSREPVVSYDEPTVQGALDRLKPAGLVRFVHPSHGERSTRFRHVAEERLILGRPELAVLSVLALRGPQSSTELRTRAERQHPFASVGEVEAVLAALAAREERLAVELPRRPGQQHQRWAHLLGGPVDVDALAREAADRADGGGAGRSAQGDRVAALEAQVAELGARLARLEAELGI